MYAVYWLGVKGLGGGEGGLGLGASSENYATLPQTLNNLHPLNARSLNPKHFRVRRGGGVLYGGTGSLNCIELGTHAVLHKMFKPCSRNPGHLDPKP